MKYILAESTIESAVINALGSEHFNPDQVIEKLRQIELEMKEKGEHTGSIIAIMNILPEITSEAKKLY